MDNDRVVLHVEDDDAAAYLFRVALEEANIRAVVYRVSDGEQALAFLHHRHPYEHAPRPCVAIIDLNLPRVDGWTVLTEVQKDSIPAIVVTTSSVRSDRTRALSVGAVAYVVKSNSFDDFVREVKTAFAIHLPDWPQMHQESMTIP
ncbi:MAG: response regulator [Acidobacteriaceae bacterium]|nr:response regulator [Acidobacteriaceae bacterium]MBV8569700.1 response regulator [Acidobacteriaceae bacterium]